MTKVSTVTQK